MQLFYKITNEEKTKFKYILAAAKILQLKTDLFPAMLNSAGLRAGGI